MRMNTHFLLMCPGSRISKSIALVTLFWFLGLLTGIGLAVVSPMDVTAIFRSAVSEQASPVLLFFVSAFPIMALTFALYLGAFPICSVLVFLNAICRGFSGMLIYLSLGSAAWLIRPLFLFSSSCVSVYMWWLIIRHFSKGRYHLFKDLSIVIILIFVTVMSDTFYISCFLTVLTKYF